MRIQSRRVAVVMYQGEIGIFLSSKTRRAANFSKRLPSLGTGRAAIKVILLDDRGLQNVSPEGDNARE